jgi:hypothetical protein
LAVLLALVMVTALFASTGITAMAYDGEYTILFSGESDRYFEHKYSYTNVDPTEATWNYVKITIIGGEGECGETVPIPFASEEDAEAVTWSYNTPGYDDYFWPDPDSIEIIPWGNGYAYTVYVAVNLDANFDVGPLPVGPYSLHFYLPPTPTSPEAFADFTFVVSEYPGDDGRVTKSRIGIAYYNSDGALIASGDMASVPASAYSSLATGYLPRSYVTAMDAGGQSVAGIIRSFYDRVVDGDHVPVLAQIVDNDNIPYPRDPDTDPYNWLYAVYKYSPEVGQPDFLIDTLSERVGADDYKLEDGDIVIWKLGTICDYKNLFPERIDWPPA